MLSSNIHNAIADCRVAEEVRQSVERHNNTTTRAGIRYVGGEEHQGHFRLHHARTY